ncbi:MAG: aminoglycoside adenylyltransferase domain-containing protein [Chloroflexota bacterium]
MTRTFLMEPTPYAAVNEMLGRVQTAVSDILGDQFVGLYLYGSLVTGDFSETTSDIDFLVAVREPLSNEMVTQLSEMHERLAADESKWGDELECYYLHTAALRRFVPSPEAFPHRERGEALKTEPLAEDIVIMQYILWHKGITLAGTPIRELIDAVTSEELRQAVAGLFVGWWRPMIMNQAKLQSVGYRVYAITTMCRVLYTLRYGEIVSKPEAVRWATTELDERWHRLIETAVSWQGEPLDNLAKTVELIQLVSDEIGY